MYLSKLTLFYLSFFCFLISNNLFSQNCTINAGGDQTLCISSGTSLTLDGNGNGTNTISNTILWEQVSGPTVSIVNDNKATATVPNITETGVYVFKMNQDCSTGSAEDEVTYTINVLPNVSPSIYDLGCWKDGDGGQVLDITSEMAGFSDVNVSWSLSNSSTGSVSSMTGNTITYTPDGSLISNSCQSSSAGIVQLLLTHQNDAECINGNNGQSFGISYVGYEDAPVEIYQPAMDIITQDCGLRTPLVASCEYNGQGQWSYTSSDGTAAFDVDTDNTTFVTVSDPGTYTLTWSVGGANSCVTGSDQVTITYVGNGQGVLADAGPDLSFKYSDISKLSVADAYVMAANTPGGSQEGLWTVIDGDVTIVGINQNQDNPSANMRASWGENTLRWTVTETSGDGCSAFDDVKLKVFKAPIINTISADCGGNQQERFFSVGYGEYDRSSDPNLLFTVDNLPDEIQSGDGATVRVFAQSTTTGQRAIMQLTGQYEGDEISINQSLDDFLTAYFSASERDQIIVNNDAIDIRFNILGQDLNPIKKVSGSYTATLEDFNCDGGIETNTKYISYNDNFTLSAGTDFQGPCGQKTVDLSGSDTRLNTVVQGVWSYLSGPYSGNPFSDQAVDPNQQTPILTLDDEGTYYFQFEIPEIGDCGDEQVDTMIVVRADAAPIVLPPLSLDQTGCTGASANTATLIATTPSNAPQGTWSHSGSATLPSDVDQDVIIVENIQNGQTYSFTFTATNTCTFDAETITFTADGSKCEGSIAIGGDVDKTDNLETVVTNTVIDNPGGVSLYATLVDNNNLVIATQVLPPNGVYLFEDIPSQSIPVTYEIIIGSINQTAGTSPTADANSLIGFANHLDVDGGAPDGRTFISVGNSNVSDQDFDLGQLGSISGYVFNDANRNTDISTLGSVSDPTGEDSPESGITINLLNSSDVIIGSTSTNASGYYIFENLPTGTDYSVEADLSTLPMGYTLLGEQDVDISTLSQNNNTDNESVNDSGASDGSLDVTLSSSAGNAENDVENNFYIAEPAYMVNGQVYRDNDNNGLKNETGTGTGDPSSENQLYALLLGSDDEIIKIEALNSDGQYSFLNVPNSDYTVKITETNETGNEGFSPSGNSKITRHVYSGETLNGIEVDDDAINGEIDILVNSANVIDVDFGIIRAFRIRGKAWLESVTPDNMQSDPNQEPPVQTQTVELYDEDPNNDPAPFPIEMVSTDTDGNYEFSNLEPKPYFIKFPNNDLGSYELPNGEEVLAVTLVDEDEEEQNFAFDPVLLAIHIGSIYTYEESDETTVAVYPNPIGSDGILNVNILNLINDEVAAISIFDISGRLLTQKTTFREGIVEFSLDNSSTELLFVSVQTKTTKEFITIIR